MDQVVIGYIRIKNGPITNLIGYKILLGPPDSPTHSDSPSESGLVRIQKDTKLTMVRKPGKPQEILSGFLKIKGIVFLQLAATRRCHHVHVEF